MEQLPLSECDWA